MNPRDLLPSNRLEASERTGESLAASLGAVDAGTWRGIGFGPCKAPPTKPKSVSREESKLSIAPKPRGLLGSFLEVPSNAHHQSG